eukprot:2352217-Amphidinium_carterae.1
MCCGADPAKVHQCAKCLQPGHGAHVCSSAKARDPASAKSGGKAHRRPMVDDAVIAEVLPADAGGGADDSTAVRSDAVLMPSRIQRPLWPQVWFTDGKTRQCSRYEQQELWMTSTVGGLRRTALSMQWLPGGRSAGLKVRLALYKCFQQRPEILSTCHGAIGRDDVDALTDADVADCRHVMATALGIEECQGTLCNLWDAFFDWWVKYAGDPDDQVGQWLREGAPMGLRLQPEARGVFPQHEVQDRDDPELLRTPLDWDEDDGPNYSHAVTEFEQYELKGYVRVMTKEAHGKVKHRIIFDAKASGLSGASLNPERVLLPR